MIKTTIMRHGREREVRGRLQEFSDLPESAQTMFKTIASELNAVEKGITDVYVFGSYFWGIWDEKSDYDVRVHNAPTEAIIGFKETFEKKHDCKIDLLWARSPGNRMKLIKIPL